jgi:acetyltransferase-like isoleucine patch superfamily enzyme
MNIKFFINLRLVTLLVTIYYRLFKRNIVLGKNVKFNKVPIIHSKKNTSIIIGDNVSLNSNNYGYHLNMFGKIKLITDRPNATIEIGTNTRIHGTCIHAYKKIHIGENCLIAANCQIFDGNAHDLSFPLVEKRINTTGGAKEIVINDNVWIGTDCIILPGANIGYGSVISAGSVVANNIPSMCIAGGNPAKVIKQY